MKRLLVISLALASLSGATKLQAEETKSKSPIAPRDSISVIKRTSSRMAQILDREMLELLRSAKHDFHQLKRATRGNYEAEQILHRFVDTMGAVEEASRKLNNRLLPRLLQAVDSISSGGHGGHGHGHSHHGGNSIAAHELVRLMEREVAGRKKLQVLRNSVRFVRNFDGQSMIDMVQQMVSSSDQAEACEIVGSQSDIRLSSHQLCGVLNPIVSDSDKLRAAKALVKGVSDLNPITVERICQCFISFRNQRKFKEYATHTMHQY